MMRKAALLAALGMAVAGLTFSQMGTFAGKVIGPDGKGLQNAVIKIQRKDIKGNWQTKTNKRGEWIYSGMQIGGTYRIECHVNNQLLDVVDGVRASMGEPQEIVFDLQKRAAEQAARQKAMETGQLTEEMKRDMSPEQRAAMEKQMKAQQQQLAKNKALNDAFNEAMTALNAKDFAASAAAFEKAAELDPKQFAVWANMASAYEGLAATDKTMFDKAANAYTKALELKPDDAGLHNNYALMLVKMGKIEEAAAMLDKAAALDPPNAGRYFFNLGAVMVNNRQDDGALAAFDKCIAAAPNYANCYYYKANVLSGRMRLEGDKAVAPDGMIPALEKYLELEPNGQHADAAKGLLSVFATGVQTTYTNPDAKKAPSRKKK
jgi:Tfp pilus assembly protein PilF